MLNPESQRFELASVSPAATPDMPPWPLAPRHETRDVARGHHPPVVSAEWELSDWGDLLNAVSQRLRAIVGRRLVTLSGLPVNDARSRTQTGVLDCATALDQLHALVLRQLEGQRRLEHEMATTQAALAQARAELAGTLAGERFARHQALHDGLTSLPNLRYFNERLAAAVAQPASAPGTLTVLYIDLDGFKAVNDTHGHHTGDELLRIVAARLSRATRTSDLFCRIGGDEFACLLTEQIQHDELQRLACKLFDAVSAPLLIDSLRLTISPSIGIATCAADASGARTLLKHADQAMYRAKQHRSGYAFFEAVAGDLPKAPSAT